MHLRVVQIPGYMHAGGLEEDGGGGLDEAQIQKKRDENVKWAKVQDSNISFSDRT